MKRFLGFGIGLFLVIGFTSSAKAINIDVAEVQNGLAFVQGGKAAANATITWEGGNVVIANRNGGFKFSGVVPLDCVGTLSDGVDTIEVALVNCTPSALYKTGQTQCFDNNFPAIETDCTGTGLDGETQAGAPLRRS